MNKSSMFLSLLVLFLMSVSAHGASQARPKISSVLFNPATINAGQPIAISATTDNDASNVVFRITDTTPPTDLVMSSGEAAGNRKHWLLNYSFAQPGTHPYIAISYDQAGKYAGDKSGMLQIFAPNVIKAGVNPSQMKAGQSAVFSATTDTAATKVIVRITDTNPVTDLSMLGSGTNWTLTQPFNTPGTRPFIVIAFNQFAKNGTTQMGNLKVTANNKKEDKTGAVKDGTDQSTAPERKKEPGTKKDTNQPDKKPDKSPSEPPTVKISATPDVVANKGDKIIIRAEAADDKSLQRMDITSQYGTGAKKPLDTDTLRKSGSTTALVEFDYVTTDVGLLKLCAIAVDTSGNKSKEACTTVKINVSEAPLTVKTSGSGANGTISPPTQQVVSGKPANVILTTQPNYKANLSGCGLMLTGVTSGTYPISAVTADCEVKAEFVVIPPGSFAVTVAPYICGTVAPQQQNVAVGKSGTFTFTPNVDSIISVTGCDGKLVGTTYTTGLMSAPCTIQAACETIKFTVTGTAGAGGSIALATQQVAYGKSTTLTAAPLSGYQIKGVTGCGGTLKDTIYTTGAITSSCEVKAEFAMIPPSSYTATVAPYSCGTVAPQQQNVAVGKSGTFTFTPNVDSIISVTGCDGKLVGTTYTTGLISAPCTIQAACETIKLTVTGTAGQGGSIALATQQVAYGKSTTLTAAPLSGYQIKGVTGCGGTLKDLVYTTGAITANCEVKAEFAMIPPSSYTATVAPYSCGTVAPQQQNVSAGKSGTFVFAPNVDSMISVTGCDGKLVGTAYTTGLMSAPCTIQAACETIKLTVTGTAGQGGSVTPATQQVPYGKITTLNLSPLSGYEISGVTTGCGGSGKPAGTVYTTGTITASCEVKVAFAQILGEVMTVIQPKEAVSAGAKWQLDSGTWQDDNGRFNTTPGTHTVTFKDITGWKTPAAQKIDVKSNGTTPVTEGRYLSVVIGNCGPSKGSCTSGDATPLIVSGNNSVWNCTGINGGATANCSVPNPINGVCNTTTLSACSQGGAVSFNPIARTWSCNGINGGQATPSLSICSQGSAVQLDAEMSKWSCSGLNGGSSDVCNFPVQGRCGNTPGSCLLGGVFSVNSGAGTWICSGLNGGLPAACTVPVPGSCGTTLGVCSQGSAVSLNAALGTWSCNGINGGQVTPCKTAVPGICNTTTLGSCNQGIAASINQSLFTWDCNGINGGANATGCKIPQPGICSTTLGTCSQGSPGSVNSGAGTWSCGGINGGQVTPCKTAVPGICNTSTLGTCNQGIAASINQSLFTWDCNGINGGTNATGCKIPKPGICNTSTLGACSQGSAVSINAGAGTWKCNGINNGAVAACTIINKTCSYSTYPVCSSSGIALWPSNNQSDRAVSTSASRAELHFNIQNGGKVAWSNYKFIVRSVDEGVCIDQYNGTTQPLFAASGGATIDAKLDMDIPRKPGTYYVVLDIVDTKQGCILKTPATTLNGRKIDGPVGFNLVAN